MFRPAPVPQGPLNRRRFLSVSAGLALAAGSGAAGTLTGGGSDGVAHRAAGSAAPSTAPPPRPAQPAGRGPYTAGTTIDSVATPRGTGGYRRLGDGPGWPRVVRADLAGARSGREGRRGVLAAFVQLTDLHLTDVQGPLRFEYLRVAGVNVWKPQEALGVAGMVSLVERINSLAGGPATGGALSCVVSTGDNCDNNETVELDWFLAGANGGRIVPDTGDPDVFEGVQNSGLPLYWQPDSTMRDQDKAVGYPYAPGLLAAATSAIDSPGLRLPWYSTAGNHDSMTGGVYGLTDPDLIDLATGTRKIQSVSRADATQMMKANAVGGDTKGALLRHMFDTYGKTARTVTADPRRGPISRHGFLTAHLDPAQTGPGPVGHGFTAANLADDRLYYTFALSENVLGVSLDTTDRAGDSPGSIGAAQFAWLGAVLTANRDRRVVVFSHHTSDTMTNTRPDPDAPDEKRHTGDEVRVLLGAHHNVVAWINGHIHANKITPRHGFWEISTASHVDFPQLARVVEITDNHDGTLSIFTTLVESAAPHRADPADHTPAGLASLYRELGFNRPGGSKALAGLSTDRNTELLLRA